VLRLGLILLKLDNFIKIKIRNNIAKASICILLRLAKQFPKLVIIVLKLEFVLLKLDYFIKIINSFAKVAKAIIKFAKVNINFAKVRTNFGNIRTSIAKVAKGSICILLRLAKQFPRLVIIVLKLEFILLELDYFIKIIN
jgi:predicted TIM-barrel fold metal-dependent hydrolase